MKDIAKAIEVEQTYLAARMKGEYPFHLVDKIRECGFDSLDEYFDGKKAQEFGKLDFQMVVEPMPGGVAEIFKMIQANRAGVLFADWENTFVVCGDQGLQDFNRQYCEDNGITFFPLYTGGGSIVGSRGDFSFGVCFPNDKHIDPEYVLDGVKNILQRHTGKVISVAGNDILADGCKICGSACYQGLNVLMIIMHFSFGDQTDLISAICTTAKIGKPVTYVDFMTRETFKTEVAEWLRVQSV